MSQRAIGFRALLFVGLAVVGCHAEVRPDEPLPTPAPDTVVLAHAPDGHWYVGYDSQMEVTAQRDLTFPRVTADWGPAPKLLLVEEGASPQPLDGFGGSDPTGRYVVLDRAGQVVLRDTVAHDERDLTPLGLVAPPCGRLVDFDAGGHRAHFLREVDGHRSQEVLDLSSGVARDFPVDERKLERSELSADGRWLRERLFREPAPGEQTDIERHADLNLGPLDVCDVQVDEVSPVRPGTAWPYVQRWRALSTGLTVEGGLTTFHAAVVVEREGSLLGVEPDGSSHALVPADCGARLAFASDRFDVLGVQCRSQGNRLFLVVGGRLVNTGLEPVDRFVHATGIRPRILVTQANSTAGEANRKLTVWLDLKTRTWMPAPADTLIAEGQSWMLASGRDGTFLIGLDQQGAKRLVPTRLTPRDAALPWVWIGGDELGHTLLVDVDTGEVRLLRPFQTKSIAAVDREGRVLVRVDASAGTGLRWESAPNP
jgi:hypothetical protein